MRAVAIVKFATGTRKEQNMYTRRKMYETLGAGGLLLLICGTQLNALQLTLWQAREKALEARSKPAGSQNAHIRVPAASLQGAYTFFSFDAPSSVYGTVIEGINSRGKMVGAYADSSFGARYFVLIDGEFKDVGPPDTSPFAPPLYLATSTGINSQGDVVGNYTDTSGSHGFLLKNGIYTNIDAPWADPLGFGTTAAGVNSEGDIVGFYQTSSDAVLGFLLTQGSYVNVPTAVFGAQWSAINPAGNILGEYFDSGGNIHGFLLKKGVLTDVVVPGAGQVVPLGMNAQGDIVGTTFYSTPSCGFLLSHGTVMTVDSLLPNSPCTFPYGINEQGDIVGTYFDNVGTGMHGFFLKKNTD